MPFCGFNKKMLEGLVAFHEGLVEHGLIARAEKRNQSVEQTIQKEIGDMTRFLGETHRMADPQVREMVESLTTYAKAFYQLLNARGHDDYKQLVRRLSKFYENMDGKFYSEFEGQKDDMKKLAEYLSSQKI